MSVFNNGSNFYLNAHLNDIHVVGVVIFKYFFALVKTFLLQVKDSDTQINNAFLKIKLTVKVKRSPTVG